MGQAVDRLVALARTVRVKGYLRQQGGKIVSVEGHTRFLGNDGAGNVIEVGALASIVSGPDKGTRGTVTGAAKGGGIRIKVEGSLGQSREVLADPDEIRVKKPIGVGKGKRFPGPGEDWR